MLLECPLVGCCGEVIWISSLVHNFAESFLWYLFISPPALRAEVQSRLHRDQDYPCEVVGSWNTWYGDQDQAGKQHGERKQQSPLHASPPTHDKSITYRTFIDNNNKDVSWWAWICGYVGDVPPHAVLQWHLLLFLLQCICGDTEEDIQLWLNAWTGWRPTR